MDEWLPLGCAMSSVAFGVVTAFGLRHVGRAATWNVYLKLLSVDVTTRRELALETARLDLKIQARASQLSGQRERESSSTNQESPDPGAKE